MNLEQLKNELSLSTLPECFPALYECMKNTWEAHAAHILSGTYIEETLTACYALAPYREAILEAAAAVRRSKALCLFVCLLEQWVRTGGSPDDAAYEAPKGEGPAFDFLHLFPVIPTMPDSVEFLRRRGVPEDVIADTLREYDSSVQNMALRTGKPVFDASRLSWLCHIVHNRLIHINRFKYDLPGKFLQGVRVYRHREGQLAVLADNVHVHRTGRVLGSVGHTDTAGSFLAQVCETPDAYIGHPVAENGLVQPQPVTLPKTAWELCLCGEDDVLRIHIPREGPFDKPTIADSYARAREVFAACFPDRPYKAFFCSSWLMSQDLHDILKPTSNILAFQNDFRKTPFLSTGTLVFSFAFSMGAAIPENLQALPENTSLQRAVKERYCQGGYVHEGAGFFF